MTKSELITRLKNISRNECRTRGLYTIIQMLIVYFNDERIPEYEHQRIFHSLPMHVVRAVDILRTSTDPTIEELRKKYIEDRDGSEDIPNLTDIAFGGSARTVSCTTLSHNLAKLLLGKDSVWLEKDLSAYFTAQDTVVMQMIHSFDHKVYQQGLCAIINVCPQSGMSGMFGTTFLRSFVTAGRIMFMLGRRIGGETIILGPNGEEIKRLPYQELSISFVGEDGQKSEPRFGIQSMNADLSTIISMFEDVMRNWPETKEEQAKMYIADEDISII